VKNRPIDARHLILYIHLYTEHYINLICESKKIRGKNLREKCEKLLQIGSLTQKAFNLIKLIIKLRNKLVHSLTITLQEVDKELDKMDFLFHTTEPDLVWVLNSADKWQRLHIFSVSLITILYTIACDVYKIKPRYTIRPEVYIHKIKKPTWKMVLLKKNE